jgi:hypothetical protein
MACVIVRKGAAEAGTIYVCIRIDGDNVWLMGPPAGPSLDEHGDRIFEPRFEKAVSEQEVDEYLSRQAGYDPDIWIVEVEDRGGRAFLR